MKRTDLIGLMPKDKDDREAAIALVRLGSPAVAPILRDMLRWLQVYGSPVADVFAEFFATLSPPPIALVARHLGTRSETLRTRLLVDILPAWPGEAVRQLSLQLTTLATHPDTSNNDLACMRLILKHELADQQWVRQWLGFRKGQSTHRLRLLEELEKQFD